MPPLPPVTLPDGGSVDVHCSLGDGYLTTLRISLHDGVHIVVERVEGDMPLEVVVR